MNISRLVMASAIGISTAQTGSQAVNTEKKEIPAEVILLVGADKTILAYQSVRSSDGMNETIALLARKQRKGPSVSEAKYDYEVEYTCDLIAMQKDSSGVRITGKSSEVVNCNVNDEHRRAKYRELDEAIQLTPASLTYEVTGNTTRSGWWSYSFAIRDGDWYVSSAKNVSSFDTSDDGYIIVRTEEARYPDDFGSIPMGKLDAKAMADVLSKHVMRED